MKTFILMLALLMPFDFMGMGDNQHIDLSGATEAYINANFWGAKDEL